MAAESFGTTALPCKPTSAYSELDILTYTYHNYTSKKNLHSGIPVLIFTWENPIKVAYYSFSQT